ncbi:unnamed protein product [Peronospora effusa]|nr:unnamed protein product [Peronospora effusa]
MKFPLPKNLFPPLDLSENQEADFEQLANTLIKATLAEYDQFVVHDRKRVDSQRWKPVRSRDGVSIYRECNVDSVGQQAPTSLALYQTTISVNPSRPSQHRGRLMSDNKNRVISANITRSYGPSSPRKNKSSYGMDSFEDSRDTTGIDSCSSGDLLSEPRITTGAYSSTDEDDSGLPRLLAVGNLRGSLDDVMYGIASPNASSSRLRSSYLGEHIADCSVLREIKSPSPADPFRFLGIKWLVRAKYRGAARIVLPRDFVVLEFSGVMMRPDNTRVGFHLMHSIHIPTCRELHEHRILRAKVSSCYIFEETRNNHVQVFMTASIDPSGHILNRMAVRSAATALSNCWKSVSCAHNKKLAFYLQNERLSASRSSVTTSSRGGLAALTSVNELSAHETMEPVSERSNYSLTANRNRCGVCHGKLGILFTKLSCQLCSEKICNRCRIVRKLSSTTLNAQVTQSSINFCKKCVASVSDESALEIARQELWVRTRGRTRASSAVSAPHPRSSFSAERNLYAAVVLGRGSEMNSRGSEMNSRGSAATSSLSFQSSLRPSREPQFEESMMGGLSVGPLPFTSTQCSIRLQRPIVGGRLSTKSSISIYDMSVGPLSSTTRTNDSLSLDDLGMEKATAADKRAVKKEEPVVLDHRMTMNLRSLRHLDYVLSVGEEDLVDELNEIEQEETMDYGESESGDEGEGRLSNASSVAVLDDDYEMCETPTSDAPKSQRETPIVEGEEDEEEEESESEPKEKKQEEAEHEEEKRELLETEKPNKPEGNPFELLQDDEEVQQPEESNRTLELTQDQTKMVEQLPEEYDESMPMAMSVHPGDAAQHDMAMTVEMEVVEAAPVAEILSQYEDKIETDAERVCENSQSRMQRAHTEVSSSGDAVYQHQLFQQMQDLHNVVESTYQVARANTEAALKERDSGRISKPSPTNAAGNLRGVRTFSQPFAFNVVGLRSTRSLTVGIGK